MSKKGSAGAAMDNLWGSTDDDEDLILCDMPVTHSAREKTTSKTSQLKKSQSHPSSKRQTSWISSSFDGFDDFGQSSQPEKPKPSMSRKRPREKEASAVPWPSASRGKGKPLTDQLWADKYSPKTQTDLAVHKKKIGEVEGWLKDSFQNSRGGAVCLLTGPAGAGKTATLRVLARDLGLELQEWSNPVTAATQWTDDFVPSRPDFVPVGGYQSVTQSGQFRDFLLRANRYPSLQLGAQEQTRKKVILVEEVPHIFSRDISLFHDIIRQHRRTGVSPLVFIFSDIASGESAERTLFPKHLQAELGVCNISFNPIATTSMVKVMQKISSAEALQFSSRFENPSKATLEALSAASAGDIRGAINALQFVCLRGCSDITAAVTQSARADLLTGRSAKSGAKPKQTTKRKKSAGISKKGRKVEDAKEDHLAAIGGRDTSLFLFRALGKILYCKRGTAEDVPGPPPPALPAHLTLHTRDPLLVLPEEVVEKCHLTGDFFTAYLHQNYLGFYTDVEDVVRASEYLSDADYLTADWVGRPTLSQYAASVASRGLMFANSTRGRASGGATSGLGWKPLHKPAWYGTIRQMRENNAAARGLFKDLSFISPPQELLTQVLPALLQARKVVTQAQRGFLREVCQFKDQRFQFRCGERLDEKDVGEVDVGDDPQIPSLGGECGDTDTLSKDIGHQDEDQEEEEPDIEDFDD